jgi:hypothetical protein
MLTFKSYELDREVKIEEIHELDLETCRRLHIELTMAVQAMDDSIKEAFRLEADAGVPFDRDWMHRARKKRRISLSFATEAKRRLLKLEGVDGTELRQKRSLLEAQRNKFLGMRHEQLRGLLREELGPGVLEEIEAEAHELAESEFKGWLEEQGYEQLYVT